MFDLCSTCLSSGRRLVPLTSSKQMLSIINMLEISFEVDSVCWECHSMLSRINKFKQQVLTAQNILKWLTDKPNSTFETLSRLTCSSVHYDRTIYDESKENIAVKEELHIQDVTPVDEQLTDIKSEIDAEEITPSYHVEDIVPTDSNIGIKYKKTIEEESSEEMIGNELAKNDDFDAPKPEIKRDTQCRNSRKLSNNIHKVKSRGKGKSLQSKATVESMKLSKDEKKFIVKKVGIEEVYKLRECDRKSKRYQIMPYKCFKCISGFFTEETLQNHIDFKHMKGKHTCIICYVKFTRKDSLAYHYDCHFRTYQCQLCTYKNHQLSRMLTHHDKEHENGEFQCLECLKKFGGPKQLRVHKYKAHKERPKCGICGNTYSCANSLKLHLKSHTNTDTKEECHICGNKYRYLKIHLRTHDAKRETAYCVECDMVFKDEYTYSRHLMYSTRHRLDNYSCKYKCTQCEFKCMSKTVLQQHREAKHTNEFSFVCDICGKGFHRKDRVRNHILSKHEGVERPRDKICPYCGKGFHTRPILANHIRTHTGEKPYKCEMCPSTFKQRSTLYTHVKGVHKTET